jgi:hypothetical protein
MSARLEAVDSFDPSILQDELIKILRRSPETMAFTSNRATEIIAEIMSVPVVEELQARVWQLEAAVRELEEVARAGEEKSRRR